MNSVPLGTSICGLPCDASMGYCKLSIDVKPIENQIVELFPNPVDNSITLKYSDDLVIHRAFVINSIGQLSFVNINQGSISTAMLEKGIYWLKLETNKGDKILKFVK